MTEEEIIKIAIESLGYDAEEEFDDNLDWTGYDDKDYLDWLYVS